MRNKTVKLTEDSLKTHYWLKSELMQFCKDYALSMAGSKHELIHRLETFMTTGSKTQPKIIKTKDRDSHQPITSATLVKNYNNDAATRAFFISQLGKHFHFTAYLRQFTNRDNITPGLTYADLAAGWLNEQANRKNAQGKTVIDKQFEYNRFVRDFHQNEKGKSHAEMVKAWKAVKQLSGEKTYGNYQMKNELCSREEIKLIGLSARTNNKNEMNPKTAKIGELAGRFSLQGMASHIPNRKQEGVTLAVYTEYDSNEYGDYTYFIGEEVTSFENIPAGMQKLIIPAATYQKYTTPSGKMPEVVIEAWQKIWKMSADDFAGARAYVADFEVYDHRARDPANACLDIYIGIRDTNSGL